jgi:hypothetical protein
MYIIIRFSSGANAVLKRNKIPGVTNTEGKYTERIK